MTCCLVVLQVLSKRDRSSYEKIADLFSEANNRQKLRDYMSSIKLPCIPYLGELWFGMYVDLVIHFSASQ